jgi:ferric-dicitrate binding protein FerR (iron transport regulator)
MKSLIAAVCSSLVFACVTNAFAEPVASVVAVRGTATVERKNVTRDAQPKLGIELQDTVATTEGGRVKLLFIDDSVLTLAEKSRMNVETFVHSRSDRGKSLFNLLDGKMRAVVGKTRFEVKTPTVVAAARGTVILFEVGVMKGKQFTRIICLEGIVEVRSLTAGRRATPATLSPGQSILVISGQPLPTPTLLTPEEIEQLNSETSMSGAEILLPDMTPRDAIIGSVSITPIPVVPTFDRQQPAKSQPGKVDIGVKF